MTATVDWRAAIERAGGPEHAMVYGSTLRAMLDHIALVESERELARSATAAAEAKVGQERVELSEAQRALALEREALVTSRALCDEMRAELSKRDELIAAVRLEPMNGVPSRHLKAALERYEGRTP